MCFRTTAGWDRPIDDIFTDGVVVKISFMPFLTMIPTRSYLIKCTTIACSIHLIKNEGDR